MREDQYRWLCNACDKLLLENGATETRVAISWLHVMREHPVFLENYEHLFEPKSTVRKWIHLMRLRVRGMASWAWRAMRAAMADGAHWYGPKMLPDKLDILFVSHLINPSHAGNEKDFYYGDLPARLARRGYSSMVALIDHQRESPKTLISRWRHGSVRRVIFSSTLGLGAEMALRASVSEESARLRANSNDLENDLERELVNLAAIHALAAGTQASLRLARQIALLVERVRPKVIVTTFEGHAWERMAYAAARKIAPDIQCIGYQHAAVFKLQHAIRRRLDGLYDPDRILTAGTMPLDSLARSPDLKGVAIDVLGSPRFVATRGTSCRPEDIASSRENRTPSCLVMPEYIPGECYILFEYSILCARACPEIRFIWRLHPLMNFEYLIKKNNKLKHLPDNIILSKSSLDEDVARSRWALYRGTTAILHALYSGLRPLYFAREGEMTIDPLYELGVWRKSIETVTDFQNIIRTDLNGGSAETQEECREAQRSVEGFFTPLDEAKLVDVLVTSSRADNGDRVAGQ